MNIRLKAFLPLFFVALATQATAQDVDVKSTAKEQAEQTKPIINKQPQNEKKVITTAPATILTKTTATNKAEVNNQSEKKVIENPADKQEKPTKLAVVSDNKKVENTPVARKEYQGTRFKKVPLIDETGYYGKNHDRMLDYTKKYHANHTRTFNAVKNRDKAGKYFSMMDRIFDKYQIPHEMKYLAVIESALNNRALSPVGAYGPWQFMPSTGQHMGLTVTATRDDRANWSKSTHAACKYMTYLYDQLGDWLLVVAAYNSGPRPVINAIKRTGKSDYWAIKNYLPNETQNHVLAFVATASVFELIPQYASTGVPEQFDWSTLFKKAGGMANPEIEKSSNPLVYKFAKSELEKMAIVRIEKPIDLDFLAAFLQFDRSTLGRWNFDYFDFINEYKGEVSVYNLRIPKDKLEKFLENKVHIERNSTKFQ